MDLENHSLKDLISKRHLVLILSTLYLVIEKKLLQGKDLLQYKIVEGNKKGKRTLLLKTSIKYHLLKKGKNRLII